MNPSLRPAVLAAVFLTIPGCEEPNPYRYSAADAMRVNAGLYNDGREHVSTVVDTFGSPGPYKHTGGYVGFRGKPATFKVKIDGVWEKRTYVPGEDEFFHSVSFQNETGDGYLVVRKAVIRPGEESGDEPGTNPEE